MFIIKTKYLIWNIAASSLQNLHPFVIVDRHSIILQFWPTVPHPVSCSLADGRLVCINV